MRLTFALWSVCCFSQMQAVQAQDIPYSGRVTSVQESSGLSFECNGSGTTIDCDFIQTMVRQDEPLSEEQRRAMAASYVAEGAKPEDCQQFADQAQILTEGGDFGVPLTERERRDAKTALQLFAAFCSDPVETNAMALVTLAENTKARSCSIMTLPFELSFQWNGGSGRWETVSAPDGGCGVVTMSFLERDTEYPNFWNYREKTVVTNKGGSDVIRGECAAWPEGEQFYRWQGDTLHRTCEYVRFGF